MNWGINHGIEMIEMSILTSYHNFPPGICSVPEKTELWTLWTPEDRRDTTATPGAGPRAANGALQHGWHPNQLEDTGSAGLGACETRLEDGWKMGC